MLRVITSMIRNAPGPFRGARALTADFVDGLIDVISPPVDAEQPMPDTAPVSSLDSEPSQEKSSTKEPSSPPPAPAPSSEDLEGAFKNALERSEWVRKQDFKVLAIFWEADRRGLDALTAKKASKLGSEIGLTIRHENIRKVVRTRLVDKIETATVPESQPPTFQYQMTPDGKKSFESDYLKKV